MQNQINDLVAFFDGKPITSSEQVAKRFKKQHRNVLRAYDQLDCSDDFYRLNFEQVTDTYQNGKGGVQERRVIHMTKDGFMFLAMGFRGKEAARTKEAYIAAFNAMAEQIERIALSMWTRRMNLETKDATSLAKARVGSGLMLDRKRELPAIKSERAVLDAAIQPSLLN